MTRERRCRRRRRLSTAIVATALAAVALPAVAGATLPGANGRIVFDRDKGTTGTYRGIFAVNPDGSQFKDVVIAAWEDDRAPSVSPDGSRIVYADGGADPAIAMRTFSDGSAETLIDTHGPPDNVDGGPVFSPDGFRILFHASDDPDGTCCEIAWYEPGDIPAFGRLTNTTANELTPDPSPDGTKIAFSSGGQILIMNANGTGIPQPLTTSGGVEPSFSPDGTKIAFSSSRDGNPNIYVMNADGSGETRLTSGPAHEQGPSFSPDGTKIAYASGTSDDGGDIYVMNADGSAQTPIVSGPDYLDDDPHWVPLPASWGVTEDGVPGDSDGDGVLDGSDALPLDPSNRGDADADGVPDAEDAFPHDPAEHADADGDGIGDVADPDDDNDGVPDAVDAFPTNPGKSIALTVKAKPKQKFTKLSVRVGCGPSACTVKASGQAKVKPRGKRKGKRASRHVALRKGKTKAKSFKLKAKPKRAKVKAGKTKKIRLVVGGKQRKQLGRMLKRGKGSARITLRASTPAGAKVRTKVKVKLKR